MTTAVAPITTRPPSHAPSRRRPGIATLAYLGVGGGLIYAVTTAAGGLSSAYDQIDLLTSGWVALAMVMVTLRFAVIGHQLRQLSGPQRLSWSRCTAIATIAFGLGSVLPAAPAEGFALSIVELRRRAIAPRRTSLMLITSQWMNFWAVVIVFAIDRLVVTAAGELFRNRHPLGVVVVSAVLLTICAGAFWLVRRPSTGRRLAAVARILPSQRHKTTEERAHDAGSLHRDIMDTLGSRRDRVQVTATATAAVLADAAAWWFVLRAFNLDITFEVAVIAYVVATVVTWVPLLPSGLGLVEVAVPTLLHHFGVPVATGLAAVLVWRAVALALPAVAGLGTWLGMRTAGRRTELVTG